MVISLDSASAVEHLRSLRRFMQRSGGHVRQLDLSVVAFNHQYKHSKLPMALGGVLYSCDQLTRLRLTLPEAAEEGDQSSVFLADGMLEMLSGLRSLVLAAPCVVLTGSLTALTALEELQLEPAQVLEVSQAQLPSSLTSMVLALHRLDAPDLPDQVGCVGGGVAWRGPCSLTAAGWPLQISTLTRLNTLKISWAADNEATALAPLAHTLSRLTLKCGLPGSLSALTGLRSLRVLDAGKQRTVLDAAQQYGALDAALRHLRRLTNLVILSKNMAAPQSLTALTELRVLSLLSEHEPDGQLPPAGQWLARLHSLNVPAAALQPGHLFAAPRLRQLSIFLRKKEQSILFILAWARERKRLGQRVPDMLFYAVDAVVPSSTVQHVFEALPDLPVSFCDIASLPTGDHFWL